MKEFSDETKDQEVETEDEITEEEKFNQKYEQLDRDEKSRFNEQLADKNAYDEWKKDNPNGTVRDFGNSIFENMDKEKQKSVENVKDKTSENKEYEPYSDKMGEYREVPPCGLSCLITKEDYDDIKNASKFEKNGQIIGAPDGKFFAPSDQMSEMIEKSDGDFNKIKDFLGIRKNGVHTWKTDEDYLIRIDINKADADKLHPRYPTGYETGADKGFPKEQKETDENNEKANKENKDDDDNNDELGMWSGGGKTLSEEGNLGVDEYVIDQIDVNKVNISVSRVDLKKDN